MGTTLATAELTRALAARHRVVMLGGLAVISHHPEERVRQLSLGYLKELAAEGDPFARDILEKQPAR